ncbi:type IV toxin-antitoxin system AbiEi family antitoxin [Dyadobacter sp. LJ53]|uniref:type IV toxin-antitoxin system AbiEi family antitoxin n=1 Tax=Dyadobacter chenwenxiniae TaxID=2906456 RepID=UPI001F3235D7|nr:type IV toxin-antitoxin system AbiEi family antitoxin [Dyadobacter chenwenxiniae]MCF0049557.1 type IV toxin-antitoxin system AbiEi family antitoxin [Dyadobacter chenwenxiniae]
MSLQKVIKIKKLLENWLPGHVATSAWLKEIGVSRQLAQRYQSSGWIEAIGMGAYKRPKESVEWYGAVASLQKQLSLDIHVGGPTAFSIRGGGHYVRLGKEPVFLFSALNEHLPKWFTDFNWGNPIQHVKTSTFPEGIGIGTYDHHNIELKVSAPERAILECLYISPKAFDLLECYQILEGQQTLRPELMQRVLVACRSVRVKRLFLYMAEKAKLPVMKYLDLEKIDLGTGDRSIVKQGVYDAKYRISIPKELVDYV